jgi:DNA-binding MarR family transcriptional regulator
MVSEGFWSESDDRAERIEELDRARQAALAREEAVVDLPSVLRLASRAVDGLVRSTLDARGMSDVSLTGLDILGLARHPCPIVTLADRLKVTPQSAGQVVAGLAARGLVEKRAGYPDGRTVTVETTAEGRSLHSSACTAIDDALNFVAEDVSDGRLADLADDLARMADVDRGRHPWNR